METRPTILQQNDEDGGLSFGDESAKFDPQQQDLRSEPECTQDSELKEQTAGDVQLKINGLLAVNAKLIEELEVKNQEVRRMEKDHKDHLLHVETLNMMTKYQLVFLRLETGLIKMIRSHEVRQLPLMRRKFQKWKMQAHGDELSRKFTVKETLFKFERILKKLPRCVKKNKSALFQMAWRRWEREVELRRQQKTMVVEEKEVMIAEQENEQRRVELETRKQKRLQMAAQAKVLAEEKEKYHQNLEQLEYNLNRLDQEYQRLIMQNEKQQELIRKKKEMEQLQDCVEKLKFKNQSLEEEYQMLSVEMTQNSTTLESFISELNTMLEPMEEQFEDQDDYLYYDDEARYQFQDDRAPHFSPQNRYTVASPHIQQWASRDHSNSVEPGKSGGTGKGEADFLGGSSKPKMRQNSRRTQVAPARSSKMKVPTLQGNSLSNSQKASISLGMTPHGSGKGRATNFKF